jgi:outer membrane receptor for ferrienterochelin and colicin
MISPGSFDIELFESTVAIDQVVILSNIDANVSGTEMSIIRLDAKTINTLPVLLGEPDLMKTMTLMPGVQSSGDMASGFNVRGGGTDQNLILIDDVPIYNANHLFGMFSIIDTRTIKNLELFKGGAPARYGGRASSVMNIDLKEGNLKEVHGDGGIGLFSSKLTLQGPISKEKASFVIGGRTTYSDWILKRIPDLEIRNSSANFYDINFKLNFTLNRNNRLNLFTYISKDKFNYAAQNQSEYANRLGGIRWSHILNENITFSVGAFLSQYESVSAEISNPASSFEIQSGIQHLGARFRTLISIGERHSVEAGLEGNLYTFTPGRKTPFGSESDIPEEILPDENSMEYAAYLQDVFEINDRISISAGLRYSLYYLTGPLTVNQYNDGSLIDKNSWSGTREYKKGEIIKNYGGLEPRFSFRMNVTPMSSLKMGYSRNYQYLQIISNSTVVTPTDIWKSSDQYIKPAVGDQVALGYFYNIKRGVYESSVELYYKHVQNVVEYKGGAQLIMNSTLEQDLLAADLDSYGIEFLVRKNTGRLTGWVSYTYSHSFLQTKGAPPDQLVNNGERYPSYYDKPNDLSVVANYRISRRFTLGTSFTYSTGRPATYPESTVRFYNNDFPYYSDRNKYRLRDYHRLDVSITWDTSLKKKKRVYSSWILSVYNVYGRKNVYSTYYKKEVPSALNDYRKFALYELSIIGIPIPSLTYNLRF